MADQTVASEATKTALENSVNWFLSDKLRESNTPIVVKKYLTNDNVLVYLMHCNVAGSSVPRDKVQIFQRVKGGVLEHGYLLYSDHRMLKYTNEMIFGTKPDTASGNQQSPVSEEEAKVVLGQVNALGNARQTL